MINRIHDNYIVKTISPVIKDLREHVYIVGGFLRDCMLSVDSCDVDIVTENGHAKSLAKKMADKLDGYFVELDDVNQIYRVVFNDKVNYVDIADCVGKDIFEDLKRRDFTVNALAYDLLEDKLIDVNNSQKDLKDKIIREVSKENILDDPIRLLRAFRFKSQLGFEFSEELKIIINEHANLLTTTAKERINAELIKLFGGVDVADTIQLMCDCGMMSVIFPEVDEMKKIPPNTHHHLDLLAHSIETVRQIQIFYNQSCEEVKTHLSEILFAGCKRINYLKLAAFLHDVGKPCTWHIDEDTGRHRFIMHDTEGAKLIVPTLKSLKFSKKQIAYIQKIIKNHIYPAGVVTSKDTSYKTYLRFYRKMEEETIDLIALAYADRMSALGPDITKEMIDANINGLKALLDGYLEEKNKLAPLPKLLDGREIMQILGIQPSPYLGEVVSQLKEAQISSIVNSKDEAVEFIKRLKRV